MWLHHRQTAKEISARVQPGRGNSSHTGSQNKRADFRVSLFWEMGCAIPSKVTAKVKPLSSQDTKRWDVIFLDYSFQKDGSQLLQEIVPSYYTGKKPIEPLKRCTYKWKGQRKKFWKKKEQKSLPLFSTVRIKLLNYFWFFVVSVS